MIVEKIFIMVGLTKGFAQTDVDLGSGQALTRELRLIKKRTLKWPRA